MALINLDDGKTIYIVPQVEISSLDSTPTSINDTSEVIRLSATETFDKTESARLSEFPISTGATVGDHYSINGAIITFRGIISDTSLSLTSQLESLSSNSGTVVSYIKRLRGLMRGDESPIVTIYLPDGNGEENCVITNLKISRSSKHSNGYKVEVSAKKLLLATTDFTVASAGTEYEPENKQGQEVGTITESEDIVVPRHFD